MSYDTLKRMSMNLKELTVKYSYSPSNVYEHNGSRVVYDCEKGNQLIVKKSEKS